MKKVKTVVAFVSSSKTLSQKFSTIVFILWGLIQFPAFLFHELMHYLFIRLVGWDLKVIEWYFYEVINKDETTTLRSYGLKMSFTSDKSGAIVGSAAPMIGWMFAVLFLSLTGHWIVLAYFFIAFQMFFLSWMDINSMRNNGYSLKICNFLKKINNKIEKSKPTLEECPYWYE